MFVASQFPVCVFRYVQKLRIELESSTSQLFPSPGQHQRIKSVLSDLSKTASDLRHITTKAVDHVASGLMPQLRYQSLCLHMHSVLCIQIWLQILLNMAL